MAAVKDYISIAGKTWESCSRELDSWITRQCTRLDKIEGRAGSSTLYSDLNLNGHAAKNASTATPDTDDLISRRYADAVYGAAAQRLALQISGTHPLLPSPVTSGTQPIEDTHANRLATNPATNYETGQLFYETDRTVTYIVVSTLGTNSWRYQSGTMVAALASIPVDLGAGDIGFLFINSDTDTNTLYFWTGTEFVTAGYLQEVLDAGTNTATTVAILRHLTTGSAAAGFAARQVWQLENGAGTTLSVALDDAELSTVTAGAEVSLRRFWILSAGALTEALDLLTTGLLLLVGDFSWKSGTNFTGTLAHSNSGNATYNFPDATGSITYATASLTSGNLLKGGGTALVVDTGIAAPTFAPVSATIALRNQAADITTTALSNSSTAGQYRCSYYLDDTAADIAAGAVTLTIAFTDLQGATTVASTPVALTGLGTLRTSDVFFIQLASGSITYAVSHTGVFGTGKYALDICLERLA